MPDPFYSEDVPMSRLNGNTTGYARQLDCLLNRHLAKLHEIQGITAPNDKADRYSTFKIKRRKHSLSVATRASSIDTTKSRQRYMQNSVKCFKYFLRKEAHTSAKHPMLGIVRVFCEYFDRVCHYC